jgi:alpha-L-rhamnosidase
MRGEDFRKWPLDGLPNWQARWIAPVGVATQKNVYFRARYRWRLEEVPQTSILHVAAESRYRLYVNGVEVGLGPVRGTRAVLFFDSYEIAGLLRSGDNWIAIAAHSPNQPTFKAAPSQPGVLVQLDDGSQVASDDAWEVQVASSWRQDVGLYTFQVGFMEWQDLSQEPLRWQVGGDASEWKGACIISVDENLDGRELRARDIPGLREDRYRPVAVPIIAMVPKLDDSADPLVAKRMNEEPHTPFTGSCSIPRLLLAGGAAVVTPLDDGSGLAIVFDFGREINGAIELDLEGAEGVIVDIAHDECLREERLPVIVNSYAFADRYVLGNGRQLVGNVFAERGFRMVQVVIRNFDQPVKIFSVCAVDRTYPFIGRGTFYSSDALLNEIWKVSAETINACATDTFVDCPWRENAFYVNDLVVENVTSLQAFGDSRFNARCFRLAVSQVRPDGLIPAPVPAGLLPGKEEAESLDTLTLPSASLFLPQMLEEYLLYTGDRELVAELIAVAEGGLERFARWEDENGLVNPPAQFWNFIDWSYELSDVSLTGRNTAVFNWFYVQAIDSLARLFKHLGGSHESRADWVAKGSVVSQAVDRIFWNDRRGCYREWIDEEAHEQEQSGLSSQLSHAAALLSKRFPEARFAQLREALSREDLLAPELYMQHYILRALVSAGRPEEALASVRKLWGKIVLSGSRTIWECGVHQHGKSAYNGAGSICHGFSTAPIDFFQGTILGVRPTAPGFVRCSVFPHPLGLDYAKGTVPTPLGNLEIEWSREDALMTLQMRVPPGVCAEAPNGRSYGAGVHRLEYRV